MAPSTRRNSVLARKIKSLQLALAPLVPLPSGPPHPAFPKTLMAYHLLTEDELDSIAHYYHQSTPCQWTLQYPATMNWDKEYLARPARDEHEASDSVLNKSFGQEHAWLDDLVTDCIQQKASRPAAREPNPSSTLSNSARIRIKRRKVGKFIGLVDMETPSEEIIGRIQASFERAIEKSREECRRVEQAYLGRQKLG